MRKWIAKAVLWVWGLIKEEITASLNEIKEEQKAQRREIEKINQTVQGLHAHDKEALECDLASLDDQLCQQIEKCRLRGYTTASDRRRVTRMHQAYKARGGNHGEENEFALFLRLPTYEEAMRCEEA